MIVRYTYVCEACCHGWQFDDNVEGEFPSLLRTRCSMCGGPGECRGQYVVASVPRPTSPALPGSEGVEAPAPPPEPLA